MTAAGALVRIDQSIGGDYPCCMARRGREVAELRAAAPRKTRSSWGMLKGQLRLKGDLVHFDTSDLWEALK